MNKSLRLFFSLSIVCHLAMAQKADWQTLFNGKNLKHWKTVNGNAQFEVKDGTILGTAVDNTPNTFLITKKNYDDFILEYEMKVDTGLNSGVQIRSQIRSEYMNGAVHGYQVEYDDSNRSWAAGIYDESRNGWLYSLEYNPEAKKALKRGEWNQFRIEALGNRIRTFLNDQPVADLLVDYSSTGFIGLQVHTIYGQPENKGKQIRWKNIRILTENIKDNMRPETTIRQVNYLNNVLSEKEKEAGWELLWDGKTSQGWRSHKSSEFPKSGWSIHNGVLSVEESDGGESTNGGDIITVNQYKNFVLEVDFNITKGANSGIKYFVDPSLNKGAGSAIGCEFQILDDKLHPDAQKGVGGNRTLGSLYDLIPANGKLFNPHLNKKRFKGIGTWNRARVEVRGHKVTHYLNGSKIIEYTRNTQMWKALVAYSKYKNWSAFGEAQNGHILLQDHGDAVSFKNIKLLELQ